MDSAATLQMSAPVLPSTAEIERERVAAAVGGDPDAYATLVRQHQHRVFWLSGRFFRRREDVEEVAQETFLTAWKNLGGYRARAPFEHWLTRICLNCCYARLRKQRAQPPTTGLDGWNGATAPHDPSAGLEIERLLATLTPADRFILLLLDGEGRSVAEIADRLGWTRVNVKVRAHRARKRLRALLEQGP